MTNRYHSFTEFKIHIPWEQFIKGSILICFFQTSNNNQVELLYQNPNFTVPSRNHGSRFLKAGFLVSVIESAFLSAAQKHKLKKIQKAEL